MSNLLCAEGDATVLPVVVEFVCEQHERMPDHLRSGISVATLIFDYGCDQTLLALFELVLEIEHG